MYKLPEFKPESIYITPAYYHNILRKELLKEKQGIQSISLYSISSYLMKYSRKESEPMHTYLCMYKNALKELAQQLVIYKSIVLTPQFLKECYTFLESCRLLNITDKDLPDTTDAQKELKRILEVLFQLPSGMDAYLDALEQMDFTNVYLFDGTLSWSEEILYKKMIEKGAVLLPHKNIEPKISFYHAINMRQEVEAVAQMITNKNLCADDIMITLSSTAYKPLIKQIFQRYQIPFTLFHQTRASIVVQDFCILVQYYETKNRKNLMNLIANDLFTIENSALLYDYLQIFESDLSTPFEHLTTLPEQSHVFNTYDLQNLQTMQIQAEEVRNQYIEALYPLETKSIQDAFTYMLDTLAVKHPKETSMLKRIHTMLQDILPYIKEKEDLSFVVSLVEDMKTTISVESYQGIYVKDLDQHLPYRKYHFLIGATQSNYPAFSSLKGIFDEKYCRNLAFPTMEYRYQLTMKNRDRLLHSSEEFIVSYALGTYEGKSHEASLEIEEFVKCHAIPFPIKNNYVPLTRTISLDESTARKLFIKNNQINGSISAFERYMKCPYSYFLRYGLGLKEPMDHTASCASVGTLSHYILETLVKMYGKDYGEAAIETIEQLLTKEINHIKQVYPNQKDMYEVLRQRLLHTIIQRLSILKEYEEHSTLKPTKQEYAFTYEIPMEDAVTIALKGFIDRIDESSDFAAVLDYKSSAKQLSEDKILAGLQLQLLTYALVVKKEIGKDLLGAYYVSLKNEDIASKAGDISRIKKEYTPYHKEENMDLLFKKHRLQGWTMSEEIERMDDNGSHIVGVSMNKNEEIKARNMYDIDKIEALFQEIFTIIAKRILKGNIALRPIKDACLFCKYQSICRFQGIYAPETPLFEDIDLKKAKGEE